MIESKSGGLRWRAMKPSASSDCSNGGTTATMSSTTASLIASLRQNMIRKSGNRFSETIMLKQKENARACFNSVESGSGGLMQPRPFEQLGAIGRGQHHVEGDAFMVHRERHVDAGSSERPELSVEGGVT